MSGSGRRRGSKWDMKEDISPENRCDIARSNKPGIPFHERESREYGSGRRGFQRDDRMNEESMLGWDGGGHYARRMSPGPDEQRRQSRSRSPRRNRATSYRSRSKSRSRSRSPAHNLQWEPSVHRSSGKSGHSAPLCRDFAAGRCKKGDHCRFGHHSSPNHDSRKQFESKTGDGWERRRGSDGGSRHHSDSYSSGGRSTNICNDFLKGRCTRGTSCKFRHYESGSDEFGKGGKDGSNRDGDNDWRNKRGSAYDQEAHVSSEPICKFFAAGNCRNGKHCKFSHQREGQFNAERRSPDGRQREHKLAGTNKGWNDPSWGERTSLRRVPEESGWGVQESDFRDPRKSKAGDWSKEELPNHQLDDPNYMRDAANRVNETVTSHVNQFLQWESNDISVSEMKGIEKGFSDGKMLSPKSTFNSQIGHVGQLSDSLSFPKTSLPFGDQNTAQRASVEKHYLSGIIQPNISGDYPQPNSSFPVNTTPDARNSGIPHVNANISTKFSSAQGIHQINGGFGAQPISSEDNLGQSQPMFPLHQLGVESMQVSHHQPALDSNLAPVQSQTVFPSHNQNEGVQLPHTQPAIDPNPAHEAYGSNTGISQAASGVSLGQNSTLNEQLVQYSHLSATLVQLLEKREQLPQLYAAISQQTASVPPVTAASARPIQASEPKRQYDPISDSVETKLVENLIEQKSSALGASEIPSSNCYPSSLATGGMATGVQKLLTSGDELKAKDHQLNEKGPAENGKATGNKANETQETQDQGATDDMALDSGADDSKKAKDAKGIRPFKFALAEFVKELLKPTWKGGQMTKDVYKNIVKKVVDKVTDTIQVAHIPRTKEKIDQYLSLSKPKLSKLTQAYLEKYHRT